MPLVARRGLQECHPHSHGVGPEEAMANMDHTRVSIVPNKLHHLIVQSVHARRTVRARDDMESEVGLIIRCKVHVVLDWMTKGSRQTTHFPLEAHLQVLGVNVETLIQCAR